MAKSSLEKRLGREINRIAEQVIKKYKPEKIILFGPRLVENLVKIVI
ncbi:MAG: hypothetical protein QMD66_01235 [Actinomycetota bacterium]|nr:hypothetical protein [Actinomycetota bacterium]MDI6821494.1 hypothetical protein [Actinomycetota bacterium]